MRQSTNTTIDGVGSGTDQFAGSVIAKMGHYTQSAAHVSPIEADLGRVAGTLRTNRRTILVAFLILIACGAGAYLYYTTEIQALRASAREFLSLKLAQAKGRIESDLTGAATDLLFLAGHPLLRAHLEDDADAKAQLAEEYSTFASAKQKYDQIRFLNDGGDEVIRVNLRGGVGAIVPAHALQSKADRYYVGRTLRAPKGGVYVSRFDLNVEIGEIERPFKPIIRLGAPIFDRAGGLQGGVLINYLGESIFSLFDQDDDASMGEVWLVNGDGDWLVGPDPASEWAFMFEGVAHESFAEAHPAVWNDIRDAERVEMREGGETFIVLRIRPALENLDDADVWPPLFLIGHVSDETIAPMLAEPRRDALIAFGALTALAGVGVFAGARQERRRREAQWRRARAEEALRESESRLRTLLESVPDGVLVADAEGRIELANNQMTTLFGYQPDELVGERVEVLLPERFRERHVGHRGHYAEAPRARSMGAERELFGLRKDGGEFPVAVSLSPVTFDYGGRTIASIRDVTDQRRNERRIRELNARLQRDKNDLQAVNKELEAFSASVSHDLRSPLRAIDGFSDALLEDYADKLDDEGRGYLMRVRSGAQRMGALIDDMLDLARITRVDMSEDRLDISGIARQIAEELAEAEPTRTVEFAIAGDLAAQGDRRLVTIALRNLLGNAFKFTRDRADARVEVGAEDRDGETVYFVRDNGAGFDMNYAGHLFGAFKRLHDARDFPGSGVGLATVQRVIHRHGGRVWADGEVGVGASFFFTLAPEGGSK